MTDKQRRALLAQAVNSLKKTKEGYNTTGGHWKDAMAALKKLDTDLKHDIVVPVLGPVFKEGKSVLLHDLTHRTSGLPPDGTGRYWPAFDDAFVQGRVVIAPESLVVIPNPENGNLWSSANPGEAFYAKGISKLRYWFGHLDRNHPVGAKFKKGDALGRVAPNNIGGGPHVHVGVNVELLLGVGKYLTHHTDYTHGAPLIGAQLRKALNAA